MKYIDGAGDTWEDVPPAISGGVRCEVDKEHGSEMRRRDAETLYGALKIVNPYADDDTRRTIRAELAIVLQEMASDAYDEYRWREDEDASICYRMYELFESKSRALQEEAGL